MLTVRAARQRVGGGCFRQRPQQLQNGAQLPQNHAVCGAELEQVAGLSDVLRRCAPVDVAADFVVQDAVQLPDQGHQRMRGHRQRLFNAVDIEQFQAAVAGDLDRCVGGDHAEIGFRPRQRCLHVQPGLPACFAGEEGADARVRYAGGGRSMLHRVLLREG